MKDNIPGLKFEFIEDGLGDGLIKMEQYDNGADGCVIIHPLHLKFITEKLGLIASKDAQAQIDLNLIRRRMILLLNRIEYLANYLVIYSDSEHADLSYEQTYARATAEIAESFCMEFKDHEMITESCQLKLAI